MSQLIDRYVYDVTRRLPEQDRDEVEKELKSHIYDMLPDDADEHDIEEVLYKLGSPASLAEKYRKKTRYLISPAKFDEYVRILKWVLPLAGIIALAVGTALGAVDVIKSGSIDFVYFMSSILSKGISVGISAVFHALVWTTIGFAIAEHIDIKTEERREQKWSIGELPHALPNDKNGIPLSDSIVELVVTILFSVLAILLCLGIIPFVFFIQYGDIQVRTLFSPEFLSACLPVIIITGVFGIIEQSIKIKVRRWTPLVCSAVIISNLISMGVFLPLLKHSNIFSAEFTAFVQTNNWGGNDLAKFLEIGGTRLIFIIIAGIIVICSLVNCCIALYKTFRYKVTI